LLAAQGGGEGKASIEVAKPQVFDRTLRNVKVESGGLHLFSFSFLFSLFF